MKAWHFTSDTLRDGRPVPADGVVLRHTGKMVLCQSGLHASPTPFEALQYAPGPHLFLVECGGKIICGTGEQKDKLICSERTIIARMDSTPLLREFARMQALSVVHLWEPQQVVLDYLMTGDEDIRASAWAAAWAAPAASAWAGASAWAAARAAAAAAAGASASFNQSVYECFADYLGERT